MRETADVVRLEIRRRFNTSEVMERLEIVCLSCGLTIFTGDQGTIDTIELDNVLLRATYNHQHSTPSSTPAPESDQSKVGFP